MTSKKRIKLSRLTAWTYSGHARYIVSLDKAAGLRGRYTVVIKTSGDDVVIGRELPLDEARGLVSDYEHVHFEKHGFYGAEEDAQIAKAKMRHWYGDRAWKSMKAHMAVTKKKTTKKRRKA